MSIQKLIVGVKADYKPYGFRDTSGKVVGIEPELAQDVSDDWIPIYDKSDLKGYYQAIGTSGNQFRIQDSGFKVILI